MPTETTAAGATAVLDTKADQEGGVELSKTAQARERAGHTIRPLLVKAAETLTQPDAEGNQTEAQRSLSLYHDILTIPPFTSDNIPEGGIPLTGGNPVKMPEFTIGQGDSAKTYAAGEGQITSIDALYDTPNGRVFAVTVETPDGPEPTAVFDHVLADAQLAADGEQILDIIPEDQADERKALEAYLKLLEQRRTEGEPEPAPLPDDLLTSLGEKYPESLIIPDSAQIEEPTAAEAPKEESMTEVYKKVNAELSRQIEKLEKAIEGLKGAEKKAAQDRLLAMKIAREFNGPLGSFYKADALDAAIAAANKDANMTPQQRAFLIGIRNSLDGVLEQADHDFADFLSRQGLSEETLTEWQQIASDPNQGMKALLERPDVLALPNMQDQLGGADFDPAAYNKLIDESHLTPEQKAWFKKAGVGGLWILGILFGLPAALIIGGGAGVVSLSGTLAKASQ